MDEPVDLKREHHYFSWKRGYDFGFADGSEGEESLFTEHIECYPGDVEVPAAYKKGYLEGYVAGVIWLEQDGINRDCR